MGNVLAVFLFEWRRAITIPRLLWWAVLAGFPVGIMVLIRLAGGQLPSDVCAGLMFGFVPMLICMLGTFLWTAPAVSMELERKSWVYLAVRPHGSTAVLIGKYLAAITWVLPAALAGMTAAMIVAMPENFLLIWWAMVRLTCLSCPAYAAVYLLIGVIAPRRAMVVAVAYSLIIELLTSFVPAIINKLTIQFRLRSLMMTWADMPDISNQQMAALFGGDTPAGFHVLVLCCYTIAVLVASILLIRNAEFSSAAESDV